MPHALAGLAVALWFGVGACRSDGSRPSVGSAMQPGVRFDIAVPRRAPLGRPIRIVLRLANDGRAPVDLYFLGRTIAYDIVVTRGDGRVVWRRLAGEVVPAILQVRTLQAGEVLTFDEEWAPRPADGVGPGTYQVRGIIPGSPPDRMETVPVTLQLYEPPRPFDGDTTLGR